MQEFIDYINVSLTPKHFVLTKEEVEDWLGSKELSKKPPTLSS